MDSRERRERSRQNDLPAGRGRKGGLRSRRRIRGHAFHQVWTRVSLRRLIALDLILQRALNGHLTVSHPPAKGIVPVVCIPFRAEQPTAAEKPVELGRVPGEEGQ